MKVKYGVFGYVQLDTYVNVGKKQQRVVFNGGTVNSIGIRPATLETEDEVLQKAIEDDKLFRTGVIKVIKRSEIETKKTTLNSVETVTNVQEARNYFLEKGYDLKEVNSKANILALAEKVGVDFPNWSR